MNKIKKIIFFIIKTTFAIVGILMIVLFFYSAFFYKSLSIDQETAENQILEEAKKLELEEKEKLRLEEEEIQQKISEAQKKTEIKPIKTSIKDGLFVTIGDKAITKSDVVNEIKIILILNNMSYSDDKRDDLQQMAIKSIIKKTVREIEIEKYDFLEFSQKDLNNEINRLANRINFDVETLKNISISNGLDFLIIEDEIKIELLWNSLIYYLYRDRISVNLGEVDDQLKLFQNKKEFEEYLISEIVIKTVENDKLESRIKEIKNMIKAKGFDSVAMNLSISQTAVKGGDLGWLKENEISKKFRSTIKNTPIGDISEPILLSEGILFFQVRDKRKLKNIVDLEELKEQLVRAEKNKILNMYSMSHYDNLRRSITLKFFND